MGLLADQVAVLESTLAQVTTDLAAAVETIDSQTAQIAQLEVDLAACQGSIPPPPGPQPTDDFVILDPGDDLAAAISIEGAARPFWLADGLYRITASLPLLSGLMVKGQSRAAILQGSGPGGHPLYSGNASLVTLIDLTVQDFGPDATDQGGAVLRGGTGWLLSGLLMQRTNNTMIRLDTGWIVDGCEITDCGRYAFAGGPGEFAADTAKATISNFTGSRLGWKVQGATMPTDSNRGTAKFARTGGAGVQVYVSTLRSVRQGWWWDIANRTGQCWDLDIDDVQRIGLNLEAGYFRDRFWGGRIKVRNHSQEVRDNEINWPAPSGVQLSLTGNATILDIDVDEGRVGVGLINPASHYQLTNPKNDRKLMGVGDLVITGVIGPNTEKWSIASAGDAHEVYPEMRQPTDIDVFGLALPAGVPTRRDW